MESCWRALPVLVDGARILGLGLATRVQEQFVAYCDILGDANSRMNLTALSSPEAMMTGLFLDSLTCVLALPPDLRSNTRAVSAVDVGSGAGFPGIPLRLLFPHWRLTLIESVGKKAGFLRMLARTLDLDDVEVVTERAEVVGRNQEYRDRADLCLARAVAHLPTLIELCAPLVRPGGTLLFPKGRDASAEIAAAQTAALEVRCRWEETAPLPAELSHLGESRVLVRYAKTGATPQRFPRRIGLARSQPLGAASARRSTRGSQSRRG